MAIKRALVVDDSRSARTALKKLLEEHDLDVALAESGEDALEYLKKDSVDVIFMDHTMPGMDGLEAVTAIKANPKTATIPVMMYTTKEGEVYVGQARALGAVGVLPKNVQPHQLFEMLSNLGLVQERRSAIQRPAEIPAEISENLDEVDRALEEQALGMSVQTLVTRILEDQHVTLRADILRSQTSFAREVARELLREQAMSPTTVDDEPNDDPFEAQDPVLSAETSSKRSTAWAAVLVVGLVVSGFLAWQFKYERDAALSQLVSYEGARGVAVDNQVSRLNDELNASKTRTDTLQESALASLQWGANLANHKDMTEPAFSEDLAQLVSEVRSHLREMGFEGAVELTSHLGKFCLMVDEAGNYQMAPSDLPMLSCDYVGHVLEDTRYVSDRLSVEFSRLLAAQPAHLARLRLLALDAQESLPVIEYPDSNATAGEWNTVARINNRVHVRFVQAKTLAQN
jgi:CheY-like chemotaxis protein